MDIKTNAPDSAATAGQGRRSFRGSGWRPTGAASATPLTPNFLDATNINYVAELTGNDLATTAANNAAVPTARIGWGVFRSSTEEYTKKQIEDIFIPL